MAQRPDLGQGLSAGGAELAQALAALLPPLFLEARINGGQMGDQLVTQLGLSVQAAQNIDLAILTRTSGTAFVVGIGSFMAYKLLCRLVRSNCLWSALEQIRFETAQQQQQSSGGSPERGSRTVELTEGFYAVRLGGEHELLRRLDECLAEENRRQSSDSSQTGERVAVVQVRQGNALRQLVRRNQRMQQAGIAALDRKSSVEQDDQQQLQRRRGTSRFIVQRGEHQGAGDRDEDEESVLSDMTSASRVAPNPNAEDHIPPLELSDEDEDQRLASPSTGNGAGDCCSTSSTPPVSASLRLQCENELSWENEFPSASDADMRVDEIGGHDEGLFLFRERSGSLGGLSQLSAMQNLERMFRGMPAWEREAEEEEAVKLVDNALEDLRELDRLETATCSSMTSMAKMRRNADREDSRGAALSDPNFARTAYKIVVDPNDFDPSEMSSSCSQRGQLQQRQSPLALRAGTSQGIWELTSPVPPSDCDHSRASFEKIGSGVQRRATGLGAPSAMVDSVISSHSSLSAASTKHRVGPLGGGSTSSGVMFDSAIVADEDEWRDQPQAVSKSGVISRRFGDQPDPIGRPLSHISERSTPAKQRLSMARRVSDSEQSLEWD